AKLVDVPESTVGRIDVHAAEITDSASNWCGAGAGTDEDGGAHLSSGVGRIPCRHEGRDKAASGGVDRPPCRVGLHEAQADLAAGVDVDRRLETISVVAEGFAANVLAAA